MLAEDGSTPHTNGYYFSNILRASIRKTERDEQDAIGELVGTASNRFRLQPAEAHACERPSPQ